jgi:hypothetical protein
MMKKTFLASFLSLLIFFAIGVVLVSAQPGTTNPTGPGTTNPTGPGTNNPTTGINVTLNNPFNCGGIQPCSLFVLMKEIVNKIILPIGGVPLSTPVFSMSLPKGRRRKSQMLIELCSTHL